MKNVYRGFENVFYLFFWEIVPRELAAEIWFIPTTTIQVNLLLQSVSPKINFCKHTFPHYITIN